MTEAVQQAAAILNGSAVTALVGSRISPLLRAQDLTLPAVTLQRVTLTPSNAMSGDASLDITRLQIDSWGASYSDARALATAVRTAMAAALILMNSEIDGAFTEEPLTGVYRIIQEYTVFS